MKQQQVGLAKIRAKYYQANLFQVCTKRKRKFHRYFLIKKLINIALETYMNWVLLHQIQ